MSTVYTRSSIGFGIALTLIAGCAPTPSSKVQDYKPVVREFISQVNQANAEGAKPLVHADYIQHNPFIPTGRAGFLKLFPILQQNNTQAETIRMFQDGDLVVMHNHWKNATPFGAPQMVAFDVLRFDSEGLIAEHWDAMMPMTAPNPSGRTLIDGPTTVTDLDKTDENKAKVKALFKMLVTGDPEAMAGAIGEYFDPNYHQHNPDAGDGVAGFVSAVQSGKLNFKADKQHKVLGEGNFVLSISEGTHRGNPAVFYDLLRFDNGKIVEHWDVIQDIPTEGLANTNTMFGF